ncbi:hypothetical protein AKJ56_01150 [candidate division MSBL1 archaeon SCGC-AAA382N08]|uniref:Glutaredoxin domain-containing protein n=1 Tax=candidate division MSBL1 archaeon SCGC-AAA382N08 TaxID=1698285 RepID=A0A133VQ26_9EURY|nr:hypothetical protein AKJ56_01150 [candidate division MSBL1 archaeon SCGC-AAA382N08]
MTDEAVAVITAEKCSNCDTAVEDAKEILGEDLDVVEIDVTENEDAMRFLQKWGHRKIPVTYRGEIREGEFKPSSDHFSGRDRLRLKRWRDLEKRSEEK